MREFDYNGLLLATFQGKIFEQSVDRFESSTPIFIRRFLHSELLDRLDKNDSYILSLDPIEAFNDIEEQFGVSSYGKIKYPKEALFWIGYMYRYISYTRNVTTWFLFKTFSFKQMLSVYYTYHTQDPEWCVESLLELNHLDKNYLDCNYRYLNYLRQHRKQ